MEQKRNAPDDRPNPRELTCWKEIAYHLGVNIRTAQKWERERGLPVHRGAGARSRVSIDTDSIDIWKERLERTGEREHGYFCWPLGPGMAVEVRFVGGGLKPAHIELLRDYLNLVKEAVGASRNGTRRDPKSLGATRD